MSALYVSGSTKSCSLWNVLPPEIKTDPAVDAAVINKKMYYNPSEFRHIVRNYRKQKQADQSVKCGRSFAQHRSVETKIKH